MNSKKSGALFLSIVCCFIAVELAISFTPLGDNLSVIALMLISELSFMVPVAVFFFLSGSSLRECFALNKVSVYVALLCIPYTWMVTPLTAALNISTLFFTQNRATQIFDSLSGAGFFLAALFAGCIAPVCEELTFRGIIFAGIRKSGSALQAIFVSALLFGLFHMNFNQAVYAFALGLFFAAVREVTGSIIPSIICHMTLNGGSVFALWLERDIITDTEFMEEAAEQALEASSLAMALGVFIAAAFIGVAMALCMLAYIAKKHGSLSRFKAIADERISSRGEVNSVALTAGSVLAVLFMIIVAVLENIERAG